ncbi:MAG: sigma-70 family RNA polymerase sigma factor [Acidobacteriaceae bacterium]|nr:sigma-70 family RNA polymerase sigma factor [Acidobacteriaceae bacterium]MBV8573387.1 sigma-70 family RNA polymerase sigma factor [Acidobacteriaceae bacterium]
MPADTENVTRLLRAWSGGSREALDQLMPLVYNQLRALAARCLASERPGHTLHATALVNEAYFRLVGADVNINDRIHFYAVAARLLRHILVDHAKAHNRQKRGGGAPRLSLDEACYIGADAPGGMLELNEALERLAAHDARKCEIVEMLYFGGLTYEETASLLNISPATVHRELRMAKAWLHRELSGQRV